jgi:multidrug efflux pump subunit AcrA (membrane-fusion protein)
MNTHEPWPQSGSVCKIRRRLSGRILLGTLGVLVALFFLGMFPRWRANAALTSSIRDQRPTVGVISSQRPDGNANLVLPGSTQAIQETALCARTNGYLRKWNVDIGAKVEAGQLLAEIETPEVDQELNQARANVNGTEFSPLQRGSERYHAWAIARQSARPNADLGDKDGGIV